MNYEVIIEVKLNIEDVKNKTEALQLARQWEGETEIWSCASGNIFWVGKPKPIKCTQIDNVTRAD